VRELFRTFDFTFTSSIHKRRFSISTTPTHQEATYPRRQGSSFIQQPHSPLSSNKPLPSRCPPAILAPAGQQCTTRPQSVQAAWALCKSNLSPTAHYQSNAATSPPPNSECAKSNPTNCPKANGSSSSSWKVENANAGFRISPADVAKAVPLPPPLPHQTSRIWTGRPHTTKLRKRVLKPKMQGFYSALLRRL
jgi:hypothetical protein